MTARLLDGRALAERLQADLRRRAAAVSTRLGAAPRLAIVHFTPAGGQSGAAVYVRSLVRAAARSGVEPLLEALDAEGDPATAASAHIAALNADRMVAGIVVAAPAPPSVSLAEVADLIDPAKDVDGATRINAGRLARGEAAFAPSTALAVMAVLRAAGVPIAGHRAVVVGRSPIIGRPVAELLLAADATVTICHRSTPDLAEETRRAEILVVAAGAPALIGPEMVRPGATVVDCGITATDAGVVGDVTASVREVAGAITPVPGGVGPVTAMTLMGQTIDAAERLAGA